MFEQRRETHFRALISFTSSRLCCRSSYLHRFHANLCVILLSLQFQLHVKQSNLQILIAFRLHLKPGVGEGLLKCNSRDQLRVLGDSNIEDITSHVINQTFQTV